MKLNTITLAIALALTTGLAVTSQAQTMPTSAAPTLYAQNMQDKMMMTSGVFKGIEVNGGTVTHSKKDGKHMLTLSADFKIPGSPAPHWQIVDKQGNVYLLKQLRIKDDMTNRSIVIPSYIKSVAKVQIWCSFAEVNLGEATFKTAMELR